MADREPDFFTDAAVVADPRGYFDRMRAKCPVVLEDYHASLMVTGYDEALEVLTTKGDTYSSAPSVVGPLPPMPFQCAGDDIRAPLAEHRADLPWADHIVCFDGQKHADHRALLTKLLTYSRLKQNEDYLEGLADRLIDEFIDTGHCNVVPEFAHATTTYAISDLMGIPESDRAELLVLIGAPPSQIEGDAVHKAGPDPLSFLKERFDSYLMARREKPGTDLLSELANSTFRDGSTPDLNAISLLARFLFGAGQDTTSRLIAMAILVMGDDPDLQERLRQHPERIPDFLEETLRYDGPVKVTYRLAQRSTTVAGVDAPAGTIVTVSLAGASNDPRRFVNPGVFDIDRPRLRDHMAFGKGAHGCPGAPLARMEARIAIERILARTSEICISEGHHGPRDARRYNFEATYTFRSLSDLYIKFTKR